MNVRPLVDNEGMEKTTPRTLVLALVATGLGLIIVMLSSGPGIGMITGATLSIGGLCTVFCTIGLVVRRSSQRDILMRRSTRS